MNGYHGANGFLLFVVTGLLGFTPISDAVVLIDGFYVSSLPYSDLGSPRARMLTVSSGTPELPAPSGIDDGNSAGLNLPSSRHDSPVIMPTVDAPLDLPLRFSGYAQWTHQSDAFHSILRSLSPRTLEVPDFELPQVIVTRVGYQISSRTAHTDQERTIAGGRFSPTLTLSGHRNIPSGGETGGNFASYGVIILTAVLLLFSILALLLYKMAVRETKRVLQVHHNYSERVSNVVARTRRYRRTTQQTSLEHS